MILKFGNVENSFKRKREIVMKINKPLFRDVYNECLEIIAQSNDKNIKSKQKKLDDSYKKLMTEQDHELQEFYSIVHELRTYDYIKN